MDFYHSKCGGYIDPVSRECKKCHKKWSKISFLLDPRGIRVLPGTMVGVKVANSKGKSSYAKWADKVPGAGAFASKLPNWPRWVRILSVVILFGLVILLMRGCGCV